MLMLTGLGSVGKQMMTYWSKSWWRKNMQQRGNRVFYERLDRQMPPNRGRYLVVPSSQGLLLFHQKRATSGRFHILSTCKQRHFNAFRNQHEKDTKITCDMTQATEQLVSESGPLDDVQVSPGQVNKLHHKVKKKCYLQDLIIIV